MKFILPVPITETTLVDSSAAAVTSSTVTEVSYPSWVPRAIYKKNQMYSDSGVVYKCLRNHFRRSLTPASDTRHWQPQPTVAVNRNVWASGGTYALGVTQVREETHRVYECIQAHTGRTDAPEIDTAYWLDIGPTNRWAMFDRSVRTRTAAASPMTVKVKPGVVNSMAMIGVDGATSILVEMKSGTTTVYSKTVNMRDAQPCVDWWEFFYSELVPLTAFVLTDLPPYPDGEITVTATGASTIGVGVMVVGTLTEIGRTLVGAGIEIDDYSLTDEDDYGTVDPKEGPYSGMLDVNMIVPKKKLDYMKNKLASVRATPCVWFDESGFESMIIYGLCPSWRINVTYTYHLDVSISLKEMA